jgi:CubicO group peptidase (beta-lactamase class C family)
MRSLSVLLLFTLASAAIATEASNPAPRQYLGYETLMKGQRLDAPVEMGAYSQPAEVHAPMQVFAGRLSFSAKQRRSGSRVLRDTDGYIAAAGRAILRLPKFDFEFVQSGDALIPLRRGTLPGDNQYWEYLLEPGRVWQEPGDRGLTRAAIPFALQERNANCMHHGVLSFLFSSDGVMSQVAYQISSETCLYFQFDLWGLADARYTPRESPEAASIVRAYEQELRSRLPVKPIAALAGDFPGADPGGFGAADEVAPDDMTAYGFLIDGVHYAGGCNTRHGPYPFCDVLDLPSYSLAKSIFASVALMRLEQQFPETSAQRIADFVPECARAGNWSDVTFENALDTATGNYLSPETWIDERAKHIMTLFNAETHGEKIRYGCGQFPRQDPPGTKWVYHTSDTYVLGTALNAFVKQRLGAEKDLYTDVVVRELWQPLGLSPVTSVTRRTYDKVAQPFTGWGLVLHRDDILRIGHWLATGEGKLDGRQMLDPRMLAATLQRVPGDRGFQWLDPTFRYQHGFYGHDVSRDIGCAEPVWVPFMAGYGGIIVALFPNDTIYYYFSDGDSFNWRRAAIAADRIRSFCTRRNGAGTQAS